MSPKRIDASLRRHLWSAITLVALAGVALIGWRSLRLPARPGPAVAPAARLEALAPFAAPRADSTPVAAPMPASVAVARDPFLDVSAPPAPVRVARTAPRPVAPPAADTSEHYTLSAILITDSRRAAVINDVLVSVGDRGPGGLRLLAVERDHVVLADSKGVRRTLTLSDGKT